MSNDVLSSLDTNWNDVKSRIERWLEANKDHKHFGVMNSFREQGFPRKSFDLKEIRNDLMGIIGSSKPWEVAVGQAIAKLDPASLEKADSLASYLGKKLVVHVFPSANPTKRKRRVVQQRSTGQDDVSVNTK